MVEGFIVYLLLVATVGWVIFREYGPERRV